MNQIDTIDSAKHGIASPPSLKLVGEEYELADLNPRNEPAEENNVGADEAPEGAASAEGQKQRSTFKLVMTVMGLFLTLFTYAIDATIVATAIPTISSDLNSTSGYAWIGSAFLLAAASSATIWAKLSDIWGRKAILLSAIAWFFVSSIVCASATSTTMLIAGRALQGAAGGGLSQIVNITISDLFSLRSRGLILGLLEVVWMVASGLGPLLGGVFSQHVSWRWIFWVNLPLCGFTFAVLWFFLDVHNPRTKMRDGLKAVDWFGCVAMVAMAVMILLGLDFGGVTFPWSSPQVICLIVFGCLTSLFFIFAEKKLAKYPLMELSLFANLHNVGCFTIYSVMGFVFISDLYFLPLYFQSAREADPVQSGLFIIPCSVAAAAVGIAVGLTVHRTGRFRELLWAGTSILAIGNGLLITLKADTPLAQVLCFGAVPGAGAGFLFSPAVIAVQANVRKDLVAAATSTMFFCELFATAVTLVIGEVVFQNSMDVQVEDLRQAGLPGHILDEISGGSAASHAQFTKTIVDKNYREMVKASFAASLQNVWIVYTCAAVVGVIGSLAVKQRELSKEHVETKTGLKKDN